MSFRSNNNFYALLRHHKYERLTFLNSAWWLKKEDKKRMAWDFFQCDKRIPALKHNHTYHRQGKDLPVVGSIKFKTFRQRCWCCHRNPKGGALRRNTNRLIIKSNCGVSCVPLMRCHFWLEAIWWYSVARLSSSLIFQSRRRRWVRCLLACVHVCCCSGPFVTLDLRSIFENLWPLNGHR